MTPMSQMTHCMHCEGIEFTVLPTDGLEKKYKCLKCGKQSTSAYFGLKWFKRPKRCTNCQHTDDDHLEGTGECMIEITDTQGSIVPCPCGGYE